MKKLFLGMCYCLIAFPLLAQHVIKIVDASNQQPIAGASVEFDNGTGFVTDNNGLINVSNRNLMATISSIGFKTVRISLEKDIQTIAMEKLNLFLQPVEVKATRAAENSPFAKTNIARKDIEKNNLGQDLPFLLNQTPSVIINSDAGNGVGYTGIRIRGTDATRINVTLNGIPYNDAESQGVYFVDLPDIASSVQSIQVQRGVGTSSNGAGAFGGTINIGTNDFKETAYGEINNSYGSFNTWKSTVKAGSGLLNNHFTIDARLSRVSSNGYIDRASSNLHSFYFSTAYINKKSSLRLNVFSGKEKTYQAWYGVNENDINTCRTCNIAGTEKPGTPYDNETDNYQQDHYQLFFNHAFNDNLSFNATAFFTKGNGYYEQYKAEQQFSNYGLPDVIIRDTTFTATDLIRQLWLKNNFYGGIYSFQYKKDNTEFTIGGGYNRYEGNHFGKIIWSQLAIPKDYQWYDLDALKTDFNLYTKWQQKLSAHFVSFVDLQYRGVKYNIDGFRDNPTLKVNQQYNFFNPKVGISYRNNEWNGFASFSVANKEPNRDDFEASTTQQPKYETLYDVELGVEKKTNNYTLGATAYYMYYHNQLVLTGKVNDVGAYTRTNIAASYRMGIELQGAFKFNTWLSLNGNIALSENNMLDFEEYVDDYDNGSQKINSFAKTPISFSPKMVAAASLNIIPFTNASIAFSAKYVGRQYLDNTGNNSRSLNAYFVQDMRLMYTLRNKIVKETAIIFQLNNILNKKYEPNGYTYSYIYNQQTTTENFLFPMAGTNFMLGVNIKL